MNINAKIKIEKEGKNLSRLFKAEKIKQQNNRANFTISIKNNNFIMDIEAKDTTAFRAIINSISKMLSVYEKTKKLIENEN